MRWRTATGTVPTFPSTVALMTASPWPTARTSPPWVTVATVPFDVLHAIVRPMMTWSSSSRGSATTRTESPVTSVVDAAVATTLVTTAEAAVTITLDSPAMPSTTARMVAVPAATPVTCPPEDTDATEEFRLDQATGRPGTTAPSCVRAVAVRRAD